MMKAAGLLLAAGLVVAFASIGCGGGGSGAKTVQLVIMDQNALHGLNKEDPAAGTFDGFSERIQLVGSALAKAQPDVATVQELKEPGDPSVGYPDARQVLLNALGSKYHAVFGTFSGKPIDIDGVGQLTLSRLPILSSENRTVSAIRSVQRITIQTEAGPVSIYNAHLEGTGAVLPTGEDQAVKEIQNVIDFVQQTRNGGPAIVAGDFNATPNDPSIKHILQAGFIDALATAGDATCAKAGDPGCTNSNMPLGDNPKHNSDHRIDYIFVLAGSNGVTATVKAASLWDNEPVNIGGGRLLWPSDHIGVRAVVELKATGNSTGRTTPSAATPSPAPLTPSL